MKPQSNRPIDGNRRRCGGCGHPLSEHRDHIGCSVPKCACLAYQERVLNQPRAAKA